uniref:FAD-dependent oxidoreductase n=1 Tax=Calditerricola satsumensis TaxID=373054 RepID=UPI00155D9D83
GRRVEARILEADAVFVRIGVEPNTDLVRGQVETNGDGTLRITAEGETSEPGVFAAGDVCTPPAFSSIALSVGQGMVAAKAIAQRLAKRDQSDGAS